jgi:hypothetical protein
MLPGAMPEAPVCLAGLPTINANARKGLIIIAPAHNKQNTTNSLPLTIVTLDPILAPLRACVVLYSSFLMTALRGLVTLVKTILGPKNTSCSQILPV